MRNVVLAVTVCVMLASAIGCSGFNALYPVYNNSTEVQLTGNNFRVVQSNVRGEAKGLHLLGIIPIWTPSLNEAMEQLRESAALEGRPRALTNVIVDSTDLFLILFSIPTMTVTADVIEFGEESGGSGQVESFGPAIVE